jgi:hypothetical protein
MAVLSPASPAGSLSALPFTKQADRIALATEMRDLMPYSTEDWSRLTSVDPVAEKLAPLQPEQAKQVFLAAFVNLFCSQHSMAYCCENS